MNGLVRWLVWLGNGLVGWLDELGKEGVRCSKVIGQLGLRECKCGLLGAGRGWAGDEYWWCLNSHNGRQILHLPPYAS